MYVIPLGTNGLFPDGENATSGYLVCAGKRKFLVDIGSGVFLKLKEILPPESLDAVIITHYHYDHVSDIGVLSYYLQTKNAKLRVYAPKDDSFYQKLIETTPYLEYRPIFENDWMLYDDLRILFYKTNHPVTTFGLSFIYGDKKFTYTSDGNLCDNLYKMLDHSDLAIIDCGFLYKDWSEDKPLLSAYHVGLLSAELNVKTPLISHFKPTISKKDLIEEARSACDRVNPCLYKRYKV